MDLIEHLKKQPWVLCWLKQLDRPVETVAELIINADTRLLVEGEPGYKQHWRTYTHTGRYDVRMLFIDGHTEFKVFMMQDFRTARRLAKKHPELLDKAQTN